MLGRPLALALAVPAGTALGVLFGWRVVFAGMSGMAVLLIFWIWVRQSVIVTVWSIAIAGGGILGGVLFGPWDAAMLPWAVISVLIPGFAVAVSAGKPSPLRGRIGQAALKPTQDDPPCRPGL